MINLRPVIGRIMLSNNHATLVFVLRMKSIDEAAVKGGGQGGTIGQIVDAPFCLK
jgi:hypothetical protein